MIEEEITVVFLHPEPFKSAPFDPDAVLPPWWRQVPRRLPWVETILFCPHCGDELDRLYPSMPGISDVRLLIETTWENTFHRKIGCGAWMERTDGFRFVQQEVRPEEKGFLLCDGCGILVREGRIPTKETPYNCNTCRQVSEALAYIAASPDGDWV